MPQRFTVRPTVDGLSALRSREAIRAIAIIEAPAIDDPARATPVHIPSDAPGMAIAGLLGFVGGQVPGMRRDIESTFTERCVILSPSTERKAEGSIVEGFDETYQNVPCRLGAKSGRERWLGNRPVEDGESMLTIAFDQNLSTSDRVRIGSTTYDVQDIGGSGLSKRVLLRGIV